MKAKMRADGARNREALLVAAEEIFVNRGFDAPLEAIASRAGVSRMTLYRNFADRETLGMAVFENRVVALEKIATDLEGEEDGFFSILEAVGHAMADSAGFADAFFRTPTPELLPRMAKLRRRCEEMMVPLLEQGHATKTVSEEIERADLKLLFHIIGGVREGDPATATVRVKRTLTLLKRGLARGRVQSG